MRTAGLWTLGAAVVLWAAIVVAVVTTPPDSGANIGAGLLFLLAVPSTVTAVVLVAASRSGRSRQAGGAPPDAAPPGGTVPAAAPAGARVGGDAAAGWGLAVGIAGFVVSWLPLGRTDAAYFTGVVVGVVLSLVGAGLGWVGLRRVRAGGDGTHGLALATVIVGLAGAGLMVPLMIEGFVLYVAPA